LTLGGAGTHAPIGVGFPPLLTSCGSVHDVERVAQRLVESCTSDLVEVANRFVVQVVERDRDDVVAADDARLWQAVLGTELDL